MNINKLFKSEYSKNLLTLSSGSLIAQVIPIFFAPVITRIYTPHEYGLYAVFYSIIMILGVIANGRYELAVVLPKEEKEAVEISVLSILISVFFSVLLFIIFLIFNNSIAHFLKVDEIKYLLLLVPFVVFLTGLGNVLQLFNTRLKNFRVLAISNIYKSSSLTITQLGLGFLKIGVIGLISGTLVSMFSGNLKMLKEFLKNKTTIKNVTLSELKSNAARYSDFPKYNIWSGLMNQFSLNIINLFVPVMFSSSILGSYSLASRMLGLPLLIIGNSISQIFLQEASVERQKTGNTSEIFRSTFKQLIFIAIPIGILLFPSVTYLFPIIFSSKWAEAGIFAQLLIPSFLLRFIATPLISVLTVMEKQKFSMYSQLMNILLIAVSIFLTKQFSLSINTFLILLTTTSSIYYLLLIYITYRISKG